MGSWARLVLVVLLLAMLVPPSAAVTKFGNSFMKKDKRLLVTPLKTLETRTAGMCVGFCAAHYACRAINHKVRAEVSRASTGSGNK